MWLINQNTTTMRAARHSLNATGLLLFLLLASLLLFSSSGAYADSSPDIDCNYCQGRGFPYVCNVTMASGICFMYSGDMRCNGEKGCQCCRTVSAAGCTLCSMEADWDAYDDDEADI
ncbi:putative membrane-associated protein [Leptomonas pyrrhocoris]|uniref:Putative membrane-associated protein n=1 Tax=Leptomonas pyrrhocoris TaxID=157538 RepID=A0A0M9G374_LEPPY|nr:putative membrane-associated protein [Leptomonas pyrrhocoris]KPA81239.1 putative membrane-associated protein [Leptomonas pyrrhocoris]|eukprot:XP_015659678.1 putative membrane-associated protein [Leptomonas pyrrhocoris]